MLFVIEIPSLISHFSRQTVIWTLFAISLVIFHWTVVLVSIWVFYSTIYKLIVLKSPLELSSICRFQITTTWSLIFSPLTIVYSTLKSKETSTLFLLIFPLTIVILLRRVNIISISMFHTILPAPLIDNLSCPQID